MNLTGKIVSLREKEVIHSTYSSDIITEITKICSEYGDLADNIVSQLDILTHKNGNPYYNPLFEKGIGAFAIYDISFNETNFWYPNEVSDFRQALYDLCQANGFYIPDACDIINVMVNYDDIPHGMVSGERVEIDDVEYIVVDDRSQMEENGMQEWVGIAVYIDSPEKLMLFMDILFDIFVDFVICESDRYRDEARKFVPFTLISEYFFEPMFSISGTMVTYLFGLFKDYIKEPVDIPEGIMNSSEWKAFKEYSKLDSLSEAILMHHVALDTDTATMCSVLIAILFKGYLERRKI